MNTRFFCLDTVLFTEQAVCLLFCYAGMEHSEVYLATGDYTFESDSIDVMIDDGGMTEAHTVQIVYRYDSEIKAKADSFINNFPSDISFFNVTDLELINYLINYDPDSFDGSDSLANYSGELKEYLKNSNFVFNIGVRAGEDSFVTERFGIAKLVYNSTVYYINSFLGARGNHAIYVSKDTGSTSNELIAAAQKRVDDYIGKGKVTIALSEKTVTEVKNETIAHYQSEIDSLSARAALLEQKIQHYNTLLNELNANPPVNYYELYQQYVNARTALESEHRDITWNLGDAYNYKHEFEESFEEGGKFEFLNDAEGDYLFDVTIGESTYLFAIIKDDAKLAVPSYASMDMNTNIEVKSNSSEIPLDTAVQAKKLTEGAEYERIIGILDIEENETYDIRLHSG